MNRKTFLARSGLSLLSALLIRIKSMAENSTPEQYFFEDDGSIPNSPFPLLVYKKAFATSGDEAAEWLEKKFAGNNWSNFWRNGVLPYHHYHSLSHEVLGIYSGSAVLQLGGEKGKKVKVETGDIIVIPAGVGHKNLGGENGFGVAGAYPDGRDYDILRGEKGERPAADERIAALPVPDFDPFLGKTGGLTGLWKKQHGDQ
ncbi:MAG: cupin domain-containing protein [Mucilaginibacter polytrichastri]|nr:cupin domain-containing protein [Mucilaginibacter polytrichastri]